MKKNGKTDRNGEKNEKSQNKLLMDTVEVVLSALVLYFIISTFIVQARVVPTGSMEPAINVGERFLANKFIYWFRPPQRGEIVVFKPPEGASQKLEYVKRVIGLPGETIELRPGMVMINGSKLEEPWIDEDYQLRVIDTSAKYRGPYKIPPGMYYMMGDNRNQSEDSRYFGPVPRNKLTGLGFWRFWPLSRMGSLTP